MSYKGRELVRMSNDLEVALSDSGKHSKTSTLFDTNLCNFNPALAKITTTVKASLRVEHATHRKFSYIATVRERAQEFKISVPFVAISDYSTMRAQHYCNEQCRPVYKLHLKRRRLIVYCKQLYLEIDC